MISQDYAAVDVTEVMKTKHVVEFAIAAREPVRLYQRGRVYMVSCSEIGAHRIKKTAAFGSVAFDVQINSYVFVLPVRRRGDANTQNKGSRPSTGEHQ